MCKTPWLTPGLPVHALWKAARWDLSKVPHQLWVTFLGSLSRGEPLSGSFTCTYILGSRFLRSSRLSWSPVLKCFALLCPYFASDFPCRVSYQLYPGARHSKLRRKPWPCRVVIEMEARTNLGRRVMEEAEIKRCGWLWCAVAHSRPVLGTHRADLHCTLVTGEVMCHAAGDGRGGPGLAECTEQKLHFQAIRDLAVGQGGWIMQIKN